MQELQSEDRQLAYAALRATLHALRDRLTVEEAVQFGAQLPMLLRGMYYEGWTPSGKPLQEDREEFLAHIQEHFGSNLDMEPEAWPALSLPCSAHISRRASSRTLS